MAIPVKRINLFLFFILFVIKNLLIMFLYLFYLSGSKLTGLFAGYDQESMVTVI
jgi:hypothetical protein